MRRRGVEGEGGGRWVRLGDLAFGLSVRDLCFGTDGHMRD